MFSWTGLSDGRIVAVAILGAISALACWLVIDFSQRDGLPIIPAGLAVASGLASVGVLFGKPFARKLAAVEAGVMAITAALGAPVVLIGMLLSLNNPDRQWQLGFGFLLLLAATVFLIWSLRVSTPGRARPSPQRGLLVAAPVVIGALVAAVMLGGNSSVRAAALPEYQLAPARATLVSEGGRPNESGVWGTVSAWAGRTYKSDMTPSAVIDFYARELAARGWSYVGPMRTTGVMAWHAWERDGFRYQVSFRCGFEPDPTCEASDQFEVRIYVP